MPDDLLRARADCDYWDDMSHLGDLSNGSQVLSREISGQPNVRKAFSTSSSGSSLQAIRSMHSSSDESGPACAARAMVVRGSTFSWVRGELIGKGSLGSVWKVLNRKTGQLMAAKEVFIDTQDKSDDRFRSALQNEIDLYKDLKHPNIVSYFGNDYVNGRLYIYLEYMPGGSIAQVLSQFGRLDEPLIARYVHDLLEGLQYLHTCDPPVLHRDIKGANILVGMDRTVKLSDFGCSKRSAGTMIQTLRGSVPWMAPEVMRQAEYGRKADVWSLGVIVYLMLSGRLPWGNTRNDDLLTKAVKAAKISTTQGPWNHISPEAKNLVHHLLTKEPKARPQCVQVLQHPWLDMGHRPEVRASLSVGDLKHLKAFGQMNSLKKAAADTLVTQLPESEIKELRGVFMEMDTNKDGTVSFAELKTALETSGVKLPKNLQQMIVECDLDGSGVLDYTEFLAATMGKKQYHQKDVVWAAFKRFDVDGSGFIDRKEVANLLNEEVRDALHLKDNPTTIDQIFAEVDQDHDNRINFNEFFDMMKSVGEGKVPGADGKENQPDQQARGPSPRQQPLRTKHLKTGRGAQVLAQSGEI
mmetsp:Transcript_121115/g.376513  ORF Transcript_121115/g.376513 Transcript_121115/m.376513 type:complete len:582 (-) Transcript_121115:20-1765(-)